MTSEFKAMIVELEKMGMSAEDIAKVEIINEYTTNEEFKSKLQCWVYETNK